MKLALANALAFGEAGFPIIPVRLYCDGERWRKQPLAIWDQATTNETTIAAWWSKQPDALPGIPLARVGWAVVDADKREGVDGVAAITNIGCLGPHSKITTPSGGLHLVFAQPDPPIAGRFKWCDGVEVLGAGCLLTCYDLEELKFPHVAPRAVLPEMFWRVRDVPVERVPKEKAKGYSALPHRDVDGLLEALRALDPKDWRGDHDGWRDLMNACKALGIDRDDFVAWSIGDPVYAHDAQHIRKEWKSLRAEHGGALYAALSARGIKLRKAQKPSVIPRAPSEQSQSRFAALDWRVRIAGILRWLERHATESDLFSASCLVAEVIATSGKPAPSVATKLLSGAARANGLAKELGANEVQRTIANGLRHVEEKVLMN